MLRVLENKANYSTLTLFYSECLQSCLVVHWLVVTALAAILTTFTIVGLCLMLKHIPQIGWRQIKFFSPQMTAADSKHNPGSGAVRQIGVSVKKWKQSLITRDIFWDVIDMDTIITLYNRDIAFYRKNHPTPTVTLEQFNEKATHGGFSQG